MNVDWEKSLAQLLGDVGYDGPATSDYKSSLVLRCESLYSKPINQFSPGDLRVMLGQNIALQHLVAPALDILEREPLVEGDYYPGDLLGTVLSRGNERPYLNFWRENPELQARLTAIVGRLQKLPEPLDNTLLQQFQTNCNPIPQTQIHASKGRKRRRQGR